MYSQADLEDAVAAGALAPEQAANLRDYVAARNGASTADEEYARLVFGYNDFLVTYACTIALFAVGLLGLFVPIDTPRLGPISGVPLLTPMLVGAGAWGLSELFLRRGGFALVGIFLSFVLGLAIFVSLLLLTMVAMASSGAMSPISIGVMGAISAGIASVLTWLHWRRFRVPAAVAWYLALGVLAIVMLVGSLLAVSPAAGTILPVLLVLCGIGLFGYAMTWDMTDPRRITTRAEVGQWVHWPAGGLISFGLSSLLGVSNGVASVGGGVAVVFLFMIFAIVGLIINRRQYVLMAVSPLMAALTSVFGGSTALMGGRTPFGSPYGGGNPFQPNYNAPYGAARSPFVGDSLTGTTATFFIVAALLLLTVFFWRPLRRALLVLTTPGLRARLPAVDQGVAAETYTFQ
jgi:hypothetical protein